MCLPAGFVCVEDLLQGQHPTDFLTRLLNRLRDFLMELTNRSERDINPEDGLGNLLAATPSYPVKTREVSEKCRKSGTETGSSFLRESRPGLPSAGTPNAFKPIFGHYRLRLRDINGLKSPVLIRQMASLGVWSKMSPAVLTRLRSNLDDLIDMIHRDQISPLALVTRLASPLAFSRLDRRLWSGLGGRSIR
jgi:hypothetical protein